MAALKAAEDRIVEYRLSLAPAGIRSPLEKGAKDSHATRQKLIDLVFRLDVSTVPADSKPVRPTASTVAAGASHAVSFTYAL